MTDHPSPTRRSRYHWLKAALQPAMLLCFAVIAALWAVLTAAVTVMVGLAEQDAFAPYERASAIFIAAAAIVCILLAAGLVIGISNRGRLAEREDLIAAQRLHLDSALANMPQGLCMFDGEQRLIVCNQQYAELYELSEELTRPGTRLKTILEHHIALGKITEDRTNIWPGVCAPQRQIARTRSPTRCATAA